MKIDFLTLFPDIVRNALDDSIIARAVSAGSLELNYYQIRDYTENKQRKVDDTPYGGGAGMLMTYQPIKSCYDDAVKIAGEKPYVLYMSPKGRILDNETAKRLATKPYIAIICGHYEGVDQRVIDKIVDEEISIGDFVLTGGEMPAAILTDAVSRFVPGVLGSDESAGDESIEGNLLEYPHYTKPAEIDGMKVPEVLQGGNHAEIEKWRREEAIKITKERRPDLFEKFEKSELNKRREIYLDNSATTPQIEEVTEEMVRIYRHFYGNPSSLHRLGFDAEKELRTAREKIALSINANAGEITFTSGGSESNNLCLKGFFEANKRAGKHVIVSAVEHPSILETAEQLKKQGVEVSLCPVDKRGIVDLEALKDLIREDTSLISVMTVNSEVGAIQPIGEIVKLKNKINPKIVVHTDCVQGYGKMKIDVRKWDVDMLSVSAHKIHGPRGVGFLYVKNGIKLSPLVNGGGQESGLRSGTENLAGICGLAKASELALNALDESHARVKKIRDNLAEKLTERFGDKVKILTDTESALPYILNVSFAPIRAEVMLHTLESKNVFVSVGSACSSHKKNRSTVLTAMGVPVSIIDGAIRISFSRFTTENDGELAYEAICESFKELKKAVYRKEK